MRLTKKSVFAIMACTYMARRPKFLVSSEEVAGACGTSVGFMNIIFTNLKNSKIVFSKKGPGGGYRLNKPFTEISLLEILNSVGERLANKDDYKELITESMPTESIDSAVSIFNILSHQTNNLLDKFKVSDFTESYNDHN